MRNVVAWAALLIPLVALIAAAFASDRERTWPSLVGDEATYLMAAQSLAYDFDIRYSSADHERFVATFGRAPEGLILQSPDHGETLLYAKPVFYPLVAAPFVRLMGLRGAMVLNALLLAVAALISAWMLRPRVGALAPVLIAIAIFGSVSFTYVFWAHADLFMASLVAIGLALALAPRPGAEEEAHAPAPVRLGCVLLALVAFTRPFYAPLLVPVLLFWLGRGRSMRHLFGPALLVLGVALSFNLLVRENWTSYSGERQGFYSYTGFPGIQAVGTSGTAGAPPRADATWRERVADRGPNSWTGEHALPFRFDSRQFVWNSLYAAVGRHVGLLPYFLPILLSLHLLRGGDVRITLLLAVGLGLLLFLLVRPLNFWGGGGAIANRYFLPLYPAMWFLAAKPLRWPAAVATLIGAGFFVYPLWLRPDSFPRDTAGGYAYVSEVAERVLPFETTQSHLKPAGREDFTLGDLWIKPLTTNLEPVLENGVVVALRIRDLNDKRLAAVEIGTTIPLRRLRVESDRGEIEIKGARQIDRTGQGAHVSWLLETERPRAKHPMWWTAEDIYLYILTFEPSSPGDVDLRLERVWHDAPPRVGRISAGASKTSRLEVAASGTASGSPARQ